MEAAVSLSNDDEAVQATNDDATQCKKYAVDRGYWDDKYIKCFCRTSDRKSPEISRGYYARVKSIQLLLHKFLTTTSCDCQVINLGAGFDTMYWLLRDQKLSPTIYIDVDFTEVTIRKCHTIKTKTALLNPLLEEGPVEISKEELQSTHYYIISCDLRKTESLSQKLMKVGVNITLPTFFLTECVLVYMEPKSTLNILHWIGTTFNTALFINYEPINPYDRFGQTMMSNLRHRGCSLLGIDACPDLVAQKKRFLECGWSHSWSLDMAQVYSLLPKDDVTRIEKLDLLDERELLTQLLQHYTLSCGFNDIHSLGLEKIKLSNQ